MSFSSSTSLARTFIFVTASATAFGAAGCTESHMACAVDLDCAAGTFCGAESRCTFECAVDVDCVADHGAGATCDRRGRCNSIRPDAGLPVDAPVPIDAPIPLRDTGPPACARVGTTIAFNHGHVLLVPVADVSAGVDRTYDITGSSGHTHTVTITAARFAALGSGLDVTVPSTPDPADGHFHDCTLQCASPTRIDAGSSMRDAGPLGASDQLDLLLMVDNSNSMVGEQVLLGVELPRVIRALASGDRDDDGLMDFTPVRSLHVGVVTSDMGAGPAVPAGETVPSCDNGLGDDGILRTVGVTSMPGCVATYPPTFDFAPPADPAAFARDVACVAVMGTGGCGFEQQLEATLKALAASSPAAAYVPARYIPPIFAGGTSGHGDNTNFGFVRPNSVLGILLVTDEEDCSVPDYSIFYRDPRFMSVGLNLRCFTFAADWLYPTSRYIDGLVALRASPSRLVYGGFVGVPTDLAGSGVSAYDAMLADPRMTERPDTSGMPPSRLLASCNTADGGEAFPPRRIVDVARGLELRGAHTTMQSICEGSFASGIGAFIDQLALALEGS